MSGPPYNRQLIVDYLLGALSGAEAEGFDELSITDPVFIDELNSVERDLIDDYVNGGLENQLRSQFESHYLSSPLRREKVQLARSFYESTPRDATKDQEVQAERTDRVTHPRPFLEAFRGGVWNRQWALVSLVLVCVTLAMAGWLIFDRSRRRFAGNEIARNENRPEASNEKIVGTKPTPQGSPETSLAESKQSQTPERVSNENKQPLSVSKSNVVSIVLAPQMRGGTAEPVVQLTTKTEYVAIRLELEPNDYSTYRVLLLTQTGGQALWRSTRSFPRTKDGDKSLNVRFPATLLKPSSYVLRVWGLSQTGIAEMITDYRFRVVRQ
jgi:hypothetical protein